jgi:hypothetical protein
MPNEERKMKLEKICTIPLRPSAIPGNEFVIYWREDEMFFISAPNSLVGDATYTEISIVNAQRLGWLCDSYLNALYTVAQMMEGAA